MPGYETVLLFLALLLIGVTTVGIVKRGRFRLCRMFLLFLVTVLLTDVLPVLWEERFWTGDFYLIRESVHNVLRFAVALELAYFAFRSFPGARSTARALLFMLLATTLFSVLAASWEFSRLPAYDEIIGQIQLPQLIGVVMAADGDLRLDPVVPPARGPHAQGHPPGLDTLPPDLLRGAEARGDPRLGGRPSPRSTTSRPGPTSSS